jgi:hypothetical protein
VRAPRRHRQDNAAIARDTRKTIIKFSRNPCGPATFFIDAIARRCATHVIGGCARQPKTPRADSESRILAIKLFLENFAFHAQVARHDAFFAGSRQS